MHVRGHPWATNVPYHRHDPPRVDAAAFWIEVTATAPCPACGAPEACAVAATGEYVRCRLARSAHPVEGGGWLHRVPVPAAVTQAERTLGASRVDSLADQRRG
jgi:hypothetical protein